MTPTDYTYTGQYSYTQDFGLMFYNARWLRSVPVGYDPALGRFAQADSIVPPGVQGLDRYAYTLNNPLRYVDPSGHIPKEEICKYLGICGKNAENDFIDQYGQELHDLLWDTKITWGDKLEWKRDGKLQIAMMVLITSNGKDFYGALWGIEGDFVGTGTYFSELLLADKEEDGRTSVQLNTSSKINDVHDLPLAFPQPDMGPNGNIPYMYAINRTDYPEGTIILGVLSAPFIFITDGLPVVVARGAQVLGVTDAVLTWVGATNTDLPYWFNDLFGSPMDYPVVCWSTLSNWSC